MWVFFLFVSWGFDTFIEQETERYAILAALCGDGYIVWGDPCKGAQWGITTFSFLPHGFLTKSTLYDLLFFRVSYLCTIQSLLYMICCCSESSCFLAFGTPQAGLCAKDLLHRRNGGGGGGVILVNLSYFFYVPFLPLICSQILSCMISGLPPWPCLRCCFFLPPSLLQSVSLR